VDLNQLYSDHQITLIRADRAATPEARSGHHNDAAEIAARIGLRQTRLGAAAACAWMAHARGAAA
jgi:hypothetical protein